MVGSVVRALVVLLCALLAASCSGDGGKPEPPVARPGAYYLSLGDSLGFGYQPGTLDFSHGYTDDLAADLRRIRPGIKTVNYSCPGETADTMIHGGCAFPVTHDAYDGAQLAAALDFLHAHAGQVSPITVSIGANDALPVVESCLSGGGCDTATMTDALRSDLGQILGALRAAAPDAEILLLKPYNPFAAKYPKSNDLVARLDDVLVAAAKTEHVRIVDGFTPINVDPPAGQDVCSLTHFCSAGDIHPTDAGYRILAQAFWKASGYERAG